MGRALCYEIDILQLTRSYFWQRKISHFRLVKIYSRSRNSRYTNLVIPKIIRYGSAKGTTGGLEHI